MFDVLEALFTLVSKLVDNIALNFDIKCELLWLHCLHTVQCSIVEIVFSFFRVRILEEFMIKTKSILSLHSIADFDSIDEVFCDGLELLCVLDLHFEDFYVNRAPGFP